MHFIVTYLVSNVSDESLHSHLTSRGSFSRRLTILLSLTSDAGSVELNSAIYRRVVWKGTNASQNFFFFFFAVRNWMCGVCACVNRQKSVSHGETVRVGSSVSVEVMAHDPISYASNSAQNCIQQETHTNTQCN